MAGTFRGNCLCGVVGAGVCIAGCAFLILAALPVVQIALGALYIHECPAGPVVPVYMMVFGILVLLVMALITLLKLLSPSAQSHSTWVVFFTILLFLFIVWLVFGSYYVYSIYPPNYEKTTTASNSSTRRISIPDLLTSENQSLHSRNHSLNLWETIQILNITNRGTNGNLTSAQQQPHQVTSVSPYCNRTMYLFAFWTTTLVLVVVGNALLLIVCLYGFMKCIDVFVQYLY
ncbi:uncharacterized protein LOC106949556 [Poecilia latipinna]|uniref:uncharacterized protein LOC106949556 n=1 Tax=Poecilia latipinna TaxID=48699 RepID=UPI00072DB2DC|nr:PREDICTED: uncharacterized protein LOC106949556 [Poecilia latipinna]